MMPAKSGIKYKNAIPFDSNTDYIDKHIIESVIEHLKREILSTGKFSRWHKRHTEHLRLIILNLHRCNILDKDMFVAYFRNKNKYTNVRRYTSIDVKYDSMVRIVDVLWKSLGYIEGKVGFYNRRLGTGKISRMRPTKKLIELLSKTYGMDSSDICRHPYEETIILKDNDKNKINYIDDTNTNKMRINLRTINGEIEEHFIGLCVDDELYDKINDYSKGVGVLSSGKFRDVIDFSKIKLKRIFNNNSFEEGGRFYHTWWQQIRSEYRKHIRIDDEPTCEVDFAGLHVNLLYAIEGLPLPTDDVYTLKGFPPETRRIVKIAFQILLNSNNEKDARIKIYKEFPRKENPYVFTSKGITHEKIIIAFKEKHKAISKYFCTGYGVKLQFIDSQIAEETLLNLSKEGIVALPVHDSFIVQKTHKGKLIETMGKVVFNKYKKVFKVKEDKTAYDAAIDFLQDELEEDLPSEERYDISWRDRSDFCKYFDQRDAWERKHSTA